MVNCNPTSTKISESRFSFKSSDVQCTYCVSPRLSISPGPGSGRYAVKKNFFDIYNHLVLVLVHLFPEYFDFLLLRSVCGSV